MRRWLGTTRSSRLGGLLLVAGAVLLVFGGAWQLGLVPGSRVTLPEPVALERAGAGVRQVQVTPTSAPVMPTATLPLAQPVATVMPTPAPTAGPLPRVAVADQQDRIELSTLPRPGYAVRLAIPSIKLETAVNQGGVKQNAQGELEWETQPFVAVHYGDLTALVGARGNAVIAGHVVTLSEGNVFRFLYQLDLDDEIQVWDDHEQLHAFRVAEVKLVLPTDVSVMLPTPEPTLTLITCGGTFDPVKREFSERLVVVAKPT